MNWSTIMPEGDDLEFCYLVRIESGHFFAVHYVAFPGMFAAKWSTMGNELGLYPETGGFAPEDYIITHWLKIEPPHD